MSKFKTILVTTVILIIMALIVGAVLFFNYNKEVKGKVTKSENKEVAVDEGDVYIPTSENATYFVNESEFLDSIDTEHLSMFKGSVPSDLLDAYPGVTFTCIDSDYTIHAEDSEYTFTFNPYESGYSMDIVKKE